MRQIKHVVVSALFTLLCFMAVTYTACTKDACKDVACFNGGACNGGTCACPSGYEGVHCETAVDLCKNVTCQNGGLCRNGACTCKAGYEGVNCEITSRDKFIGNWAGAETCTGRVNDQYTIQMGTASDINKIKITNLYNLGAEIIATVGSNSQFTFGGSAQGRNYSGTGSLAGDELTLVYTVADATVSTTCTFKGKK